MPGSSAKGLAHLPAEKFPANHIPASVLENLPIADVVLSAQASRSPLEAPGLSNFPVDRFPTDHFREVAIEYLPIADLFGF